MHQKWDERVLKTVTKGREMVVFGRPSLSTYTKDVDGEKVQVTKPVIKLTSLTSAEKPQEVESEAAKVA